MILVLLAVVAFWVTYIWAIVDAARTPDEVYVADGRSKGAVLALVVLTGILGATYYWLVIRRELKPYRDPSPTTA